MHDCMDEENGPFSQRLSCQRFELWILSSGRTVRGSKHKLKSKYAKMSSKIPSEASLLSITDMNESSDSMIVNVFREVINEDDAIWPLQLIDTDDKEQMTLLYQILRKHPHTVMHYLDEIIFPEMLAHQDLKLSTCGQELGGEILFGRRIGFSGTPSDILPVELGSCRYERGSDGKVVNYLSSPDVVHCSFLPSTWNVLSLLDFIAQVCIVSSSHEL